MAMLSYFQELSKHNFEKYTLWINFWGWASGKQLAHLILLFQELMFSRFCINPWNPKTFYAWKKSPYDKQLSMHTYSYSVVRSQSEIAWLLGNFVTFGIGIGFKVRILAY